MYVWACGGCFSHVSRFHCALELTAEGIRVHDRGSTNGVWLDKARIHVGYSVVLLWEGGRPQYVIDYRGQPLNPVLLPNLAGRRTQWYTHGWDFGLIWEW